jgi:hypothetical protein
MWDRGAVRVTGDRGDSKVHVGCFVVLAAAVLLTAGAAALPAVLAVFASVFLIPGAVLLVIAGLFAWLVFSGMWSRWRDEPDGDDPGTGTEDSGSSP